MKDAPAISLGKGERRVGATHPVMIREVINDCAERIIRNNYEGYDPADLLNTNVAWLKRLPGSALRLLTLINFYSPINLRRLLRIPKAQNTTAMVLWAAIQERLFRLDADTRYRTEIDVAIRWLLKNAVSIDGTLGWARVVDYESRSGVTHNRQSTLTFINAMAGELFLDLYTAFQEERHLDLADRVCRHLCEHVNRIETREGTCLSYTSTGQHEVLNASILAGALLNRMAETTANGTYLDLSLTILTYTLHRQNEDGSWYYSYDSRGKAKCQIDFHQCYLLDGIQTYRCVPDQTTRAARDEAFIRGARFYVETMFDRRMRPFWRYPTRYPVDVHNVAHGIYFLAKYCHLFPAYRERLELLTTQLLDKFYDRDEHYFYYQMYPGVVVRHDFFRWNTMWSLYALTEYLLFLHNIPDQPTGEATQ